MINLKVNGQSTSELELSLLTRSGVYSRPPLERQRFGVPGRYGAVLSRLATGDAKVLDTTWQIRACATPNERREKMDLVLAWFDGLLELEWDDATDRVMWATADVIPADDRFQPAPLSSIIGNLEVDIEFVAPHGVSIAKEPTILSLPADTPVDLDLGTATSAPIIYLPELSQGNTFTYRGGTGETLASLVLDSSEQVPSDMTLRIDCGLRALTLIDNSDGSETAAPEFFDHTLVDGVPFSGGFPIFDPGDAKGAAVPTFESADEAWMQYYKTYE